MHIRKATRSDAESLLELFDKLDSETEFMIFEPGERTTTVEEQSSILEAFESDSSKVMLIAEADGINGFCVLIAGQRNRNAHVASLVIGVEKAFWGTGLGTALMAAAMDSAETMGLHRLELTVLTSNKSAITLYEKFGFQKEGERKASINLKGKMVNEYYMAKV